MHTQKKLHRFLERTRENDPSKITDPALVHQIRSVLKITAGERIAFFSDGGPERIVEIVEIQKEFLHIKEIEKKTVQRPRRKITAALAITKKDHFELVVQKLSELGVNKIVPIISDRTVKTGLRLDRLQMISDEAVELSGGVDRIKISEPMKLEQALQTHTDPWVIFEETGSTEIPFPDACIFSIGPEGGWSQREMELFEDHDVHLYSLAPRTLRAETAAILAGYKLLWE